MNRVLIVDDDEDIAELISLILKKEQIDSVIINNPLEVKKVINKEKFDLIKMGILSKKRLQFDYYNTKMEKFEVFLHIFF